MSPHPYGLQGRAELAVRALTSLVDPSREGLLYFLASWQARPPRAEHGLWGCGDGSGRHVDAVTLARRILRPGSPGEGPDRAEEQIEAWMMRFLGDDGLSWLPGEPWAAPWNPKELLAGGWGKEPLAEISWAQRGTLLGLTSRYLAIGLARYYMGCGEVPPDGRFRANTHSGGVLPAAVGIARLGRTLDDAEMLAWASRVHAYVREETPDHGFLRDGLGLEGAFSDTCETCGVADLIHLGVVLAEAGACDGWDDVERLVRNQLAENQYADAGVIRRLFPGIDDRVFRMPHGGFECAESPNDLLGYDGAEACCIGGGIRAVYLSWRASVAATGNETRVRMGFTRSTPYVEVVAYEPWEGRLAVRARTDRRVQVRIPGRVARAQVRTLLDGQDARLPHSGAYADFGMLRAGQVPSLRYPLDERRTSFEVGGSHYEADWRGHTVVEIRPPGVRYPTYRRRAWAEAPIPGELVPAALTGAEAGPLW